MKVFRFLAHEAFDKQYLDFIVAHEDLSDSLKTQLQKSCTNPDAGRCLHEIPHPSLQGKLFRLHVGGPKGYRYIYLFDAKHEVVIPIYISQQPRKAFDWDIHRFLKDALQIAEDLEAGNMKRFKERIL
ncbi:MAG: hypothetical protein E6J43_12980 [Chloroflexi bacterium]|nr:MAG: hypothetical protein E6J43_12980 [Chloroflexota bacterium]